MRKALALVCTLVACSHTDGSLGDTNGRADHDGPARVLLVLAHPDDETMIGPLLMAFKQRQLDVAGIYATRGEGGSVVVEFKDGMVTKRDHPPPEELATRRMIELQNAAQAYGIAQIIELRAPDDPMRDPVTQKPSSDIDAFLKAGVWDLAVLEATIAGFAKKFEPDLVITMSLDSNNHIHHQAVRKMTEVVYEAHALGAGNPPVYVLEETDGAQGGTLEPRADELVFDARQVDPGTGQTYAEEAVEASKAYVSQEVSYEPETASTASIYLVKGAPLADPNFAWLTNR
jgi:LmbE family N-acetylglucosaminyl deacetylase